MLFTGEMVSPWFAQTAYVGLFGLTAIACLGGTLRLQRIGNAEVRRGLGALLLLSALWATTQVVYVLAPEPRAATASYTVGLVIGLATVGAWLYFCSAYAGRSYHRKPLYRRAALVVFVSITLLKLTNPWHGLYFGTTTVFEPFRQIVVDERPLFWIVAGMAYVLSAVGFYMLLDAFERAGPTPRAVKGVLLLAALPVVLDIVGYLSPPPILAINYESVGVGLFAIGALYVARKPFFTVPQYGRAQLVDEIDDAVLILGTDGRVRDYNDAALTLFPELSESITPEIEDVSEDVGTRALTDGGTVELDWNGETRYFIVSTTPISVGGTEIGAGVVCTDVTEIERQRRELRRKDEQFEGFATAITHELRNSLGVVSGQAELLSRMVSESGGSDLQPRVERIIEESGEIERTVEELQTLARYSQTIDETVFVDLEDVAREAVSRADVGDLDLRVEHSIEVEADRERLHELFQHAFRFAAGNDASRVTVRGRDGKFVIEDDGQSLERFDEAEIFAYGNPVPDPETAMMPPNVQMLATSHGWEAGIDSEHAAGTRVEISGVRTVRPTG
jgi:signal transduction histidine kinase